MSSYGYFPIKYNISEFYFISLILFLNLFSLILKMCILPALIIIFALSYNINKNKFRRMYQHY